MSGASGDSAATVVEQVIDAIVAVIADRQLSVPEVARLTHIPEKRVQGLLNRVKEPYAHEILLYCHGFDLDVADIWPSHTAA